jgi:hypothetical protein
MSGGIIKSKMESEQDSNCKHHPSNFTHVTLRVV